MTSISPRSFHTVTSIHQKKIPIIPINRITKDLLMAVTASFINLWLFMVSAIPYLLRTSNVAKPEKTAIKNSTIKNFYLTTIFSLTWLIIIDKIIYIINNFLSPETLFLLWERRFSNFPSVLITKIYFALSLEISANS